MLNDIRVQVGMHGILKTKQQLIDLNRTIIHIIHKFMLLDLVTFAYHTRVCVIICSKLVFLTGYKDTDTG